MSTSKSDSKAKFLGRAKYADHQQNFVFLQAVIFTLLMKSEKRQMLESDQNLATSTRCGFAAA